MTMQKVFETDRDMLMLLLLILAVGVIIGLLLAPRRKQGNRRHESNKNRTGRNIVFGNVIVGRDNETYLGYDDDSKTT
jgi:hypothetical protein